MLPESSWIWSHEGGIADLVRLLIVMISYVFVAVWLVAHLIRALVPRPALVTIRYSHYCEVARWALQARGIAFTELGLPVGPHVLFGLLRFVCSYRSIGAAMPQSSHPGSDLDDLPPWLRIADLRRLTRVPFYLSAGSDGRVLGDSWSVLEEACQFEVHARFKRTLDEEVGPDVRRLCYYHVLRMDPSHYCALQGSDAASTTLSAPRLEAFLFVAWERLFGVKAVLSRVCDVSEGAVAAAEVRLRAAFDAVGAVLAADPYLSSGDGGADFGGADLAWSALVGVLLLPPQYSQGAVPGGLPAASEWPVAFRSLHDELKATRAGKHALRCYVEHRAVTA